MAQKWQKLAKKIPKIGGKIWAQISICVKKLTFRNSEIHHVNCKYTPLRVTEEEKKNDSDVQGNSRNRIVLLWVKLWMISF